MRSFIVTILALSTLVAVSAETSYLQGNIDNKDLVAGPNGRIKRSDSRKKKGDRPKRGREARKLNGKGGGVSVT